MLKRTGLLLFYLLSFASFACAAPQPPLTLEAVQQRVTAEFNRLDGSLKQAAVELGKTGITGPAARKALLAACSQFSSAIDCCTVDLQGRMVTVEPARYRAFEGKDISAQEQVKRMVTFHKPVLSSVFRSVEGYDAVDVEHPVFDPKGAYIGSVSILFRPETFLAEIIKPLVAGIPMDICVMEPGGRVLYDADTSQIGLNLFSSPVYQPFEQLVRLGREIAKTGQGSGYYQFKAYPTERVVSKKAYWQTVALYGTEWRLIGIHQESETGAAGIERPALQTSAERKLEKFVTEPALRAAVATGKKDDLIRLMQRFYDETPGIYSVQWIDTKGINRFGYPAANSLAGYDFHSDKAPSDKETLRILEKQQPGSFDAPLFEGRSGSFVFKPVFKDGVYLGQLYFIRLK